MKHRSVFSSTYNEENWQSFTAQFPEVDILVGKIPLDILNALYGIIGAETYEWIYSAIFGGFTPVELSETEYGLKTLKAFIMSKPT